MMMMMMMMMMAKTRKHFVNSGVVACYVNMKTLTLFSWWLWLRLCPLWQPLHGAQQESGLLATLGKESPIVQLYDIQHASVGEITKQFVNNKRTCRSICKVLL